MESKSEGEGVERIMNIVDGGLFFRSRKRKFFIGEMVFSKIVTEFKLRRFNFGEDFFGGIKIGFLG